jgi:hypothetical protein
MAAGPYPDRSFRLLLPGAPEESAASRGVVLIAAIAVKMSDPQWIEDIGAYEPLSKDADAELVVTRGQDSTHRATASTSIRPPYKSMRVLRPSRMTLRYL